MIFINSSDVSVAINSVLGVRSLARLVKAGVLIASAWTIVATLLTIQGWLTGLHEGASIPLCSAFGYSLAISSIWAAMTPSVIEFGRRLGRRSSLVPMLGTFLAGNGAAALIHVAAFSLLYWPLYGAGQHDSLLSMGVHMLVRNVGLNVLFFSALAGIGWRTAAPLKPADHLSESVKRLRSGQREPGPVEFLRASSRGRIRLVPMRSIHWLRAAGNHAEAVTDEGVILLDESLGALDRRLPPEKFVRTHRSTIVRWDRVTEMRSRGHGDADLLLITGDAIRLSRRYRERLDQLMTALDPACIGTDPARPAGQ